MNIFVVEDEHWALAELAELLKAYEPKHRIYGFDNGEDALHAAGSLNPGLVLTDINMPGIDGLELVEKLHGRNASIKKIIVSVHDQFEYARQGMKFGVGDFLVKPVKKDSLYKAVDGMLQQIESEQRQREEMLLGSIARLLAAPELPASSPPHPFLQGTFGLVLILTEPDKPVTRSGDVDLSPCERIRHLFAPQTPEANIYCVEMDAGHQVAIIPLCSVAATAELETAVSRLFLQLQSLPWIAHVAFTVKPAGGSFYDAYSKLKERLENNRLFGKSSLLCDSSVPDADLSGLWDRVRAMEAHYKKGDLTKGEANLHDLVEAVRRLPISRRQLGLFVGDMLFSLKFNLLGAKLGSVNIHELQEDPGILKKVSDHGGLLRLLKEKILACYCDTETPYDTPKGLIPVLLGLIHHRYQSNISLQQFAAEHHVSLGYLSRLFKSHTGLSFSEYIVDYRISKAKELLSRGVNRLQDVSRLVGYEDVKHFSVLFKKWVGVTPTAYAKKWAREQKRVNE